MFYSEEKSSRLAQEYQDSHHFFDYDEQIASRFTVTVEHLRQAKTNICELLQAWW